MTADVLRFAGPARTWDEAFPVGNGRLGAMVHGGVGDALVQVNDATAWSGHPAGPGRALTELRARGVGPSTLAALRAAVADGRDDDADRLARTMQAPYAQAFQPFVDLRVGLGLGAGAPARYRGRALDLRDGFVEERVDGDGATVTTRWFASTVDGCLHGRWLGDGQRFDWRGRLTTSFVSDRDEPVTQAHGDLAQAVGRMVAFTLPYDVPPPHEPDYPARTDAGPEPPLSGVAVLLVSSDGTCPTADGDVVVQGATWIEAVLATATTSRWPEPGPLREPSEAEADALARARVALPVSVDVGDAVQSRHVADHRSLADATRLELSGLVGAGPVDTGPVHLMLPDAIDDAPRAAVAQAAFAYGRYLLMAASRPGAPPATLQGVWNDQHQPPWSSAYTLNINLQMAYWAAESVGLSSCHEPLFDHLRVLAREGEAVASRLYGVRGWVAHHNSDVWGWALPVGAGRGDPAWAGWWMGGVWLCRHLWDHYEYTLDAEFLRCTAWPLLRGAASFCVDWLVGAASDGGSVDGRLVPSPSSSPENVRMRDGGPVALCAGSTIDIALVRDLLTHAVQAAGLLGSDEPDVAEWVASLARLPEVGVGADGLVREWPGDEPAADPHHRHLSHLVGLYPLDQISVDATPELAAAAARSLAARGPGSTGWSMAWKAALHARLGDGVAFGELLDGALVRAPVRAGGPWEGGLLPNMFSTHPPFQLDGNLGLVAAVAEALVGSTRSRLVLLPALPPGWPDGTVVGLRARGALSVDLRWEAGRLIEAVLHPGVDGEREVVYSGVSRRVTLSAGTELRLVPRDRELVARA